MAKEKKTRAELAALIVEELRADPECADVDIGVTRGGPDGADWNVFMVRSGPVVHPCFGRAVDAGRRLANRYDVTD